MPDLKNEEGELQRKKGIVMDYAKKRQRRKFPVLPFQFIDFKG